MAVVHHDTFTEASDTAITSHTPETGSGYTIQFRTDAGIDPGVWSATDQASPALTFNAASSTALLITAGTSLSSAEYTISTQLGGTISGSSTIKAVWVLARFADTSNYYAAGIYPPANATDKRIIKNVGGIKTELASADTGTVSGDTFDFIVTDASKELQRNGASIPLSTSDNAITAAGLAGFGWGAVGTVTSDEVTGPGSDTTLNFFTVDETGGGGGETPAATSGPGLVIGSSLSFIGEGAVGAPDTSALPEGAGASVGVGTVSGVGQTVQAGAGASVGVATPAGVGRGVQAGTGSSAALATVTGVGRIIQSDAGEVAADALVVGVGSTIQTSAGSSVGIAAVGGIGAVTQVGAGEIAGAAAVGGEGRTVQSAAGSTAGSSTVEGVGELGTGGAEEEGAGTSAGTATVSGVGITVQAAAGSVSGAATTAGAGVVVQSDAGDVTAEAVVVGVGRTVQAAIGQSLSVSTINGVGVVAQSAVGATNGVASVAGVGSEGLPDIEITVDIEEGHALDTMTITAHSDAPIPSIETFLADRARRLNKRAQRVLPDIGVKVAIREGHEKDRLWVEIEVEPPPLEFPILGVVAIREGGGQDTVTVRASSSISASVAVMEGGGPDAMSVLASVYTPARASIDIREGSSARRSDRVSIRARTHWGDHNRALTMAFMKAMAPTLKRRRGG